MSNSNHLINFNIKDFLMSSIWCFCLLFFTLLTSQNSIQESELYMSQLGVEDGLSAGGVNSVAEDSKGYLWFGTPDGLNRYDGYRIKKYVNEPGDLNSLVSSYVNKIFIDSRGWMWVLTMSNGLHIYNENTDKFLRIPVDKTLMEVFEDKNGDIWCRGDQGCDIIQVKPGFNFKDGLRLTEDDIVIKTKGDIYPNLDEWVLESEISFSEKSDLWVYKSDTLFNFNLNKNKKKAELLFKTAIGKLDDVKLVLNPNNNQILVLGNTKLLIFDRLTKALLDSIDLPKEVISSKPIQIIDHKNRLWVFVNGFFCRMNLDTNVWEKIALQKEGVEKNQLKYAINLIQDSHNNIWIGTKGFGVFKHTDLNDFFNYYGTGRVGPFVHSIKNYDDDSVVFSVEDEESVMQILNYKKNTLKDVFLSDAVFSPLVESSFNVFFKDSKERYWLPSRQVNGEGFKILILDENLELAQEVESPLYNNNKNKALVTYVFETSDGQIWGVGSVNQGYDIQEYPHVYLSKWSEKNKQFVIQSVFKAHPKEFVFNQCITVRETADNTFWLGFETGGLLKYNTTKKVWKHFLKSDTLNQEPTYNILSSHESLESPNTNFWVGTRSGLIDFNYKTETFKIYNKKDGLTDNVIYGILVDDANRLWLSTNRGLSLFNAVTKRSLISFGLDDGLQSLEFNRRAFLKREDGTLFFGGVGGLTWFNPKDLEMKLDDSKIQITGLKLNNMIADSLLVDKTSLELPYDQRLITFEFAKLNLASTNGNRYAYKLERELNKEDWVELGNQTNITFTELSPGSYKFYISTCDINGDIDSIQDSVMFNISEPWWWNNWLKLLIVLTLIGIGYYMYFVKIKSKIKLENLKNSISRDLHDEIGSTLSSIALYGIIAEKELLSDPEKTKRLIQKINSYSINSIESMNDIVWAIKSGNETLEELVKRIRFYCTEIEETGHWKMSIQNDESVLACTLDSINMRNLFLIIKESLNNAIKHSEGNTIDIRFFSGNKDTLIVVEIEDNGIGFNDAKKSNSEESNGLINMKQRAKELNGSLKLISKENRGLKVKLIFDKRGKKI